MKTKCTEWFMIRSWAGEVLLSALLEQLIKFEYGLSLYNSILSMLNILLWLYKRIFFFLCNTHWSTYLQGGLVYTTYPQIVKRNKSMCAWVCICMCKGRRIIKQGNMLIIGEDMKRVYRISLYYSSNFSFNLKLS